ncbi:MAG: response regulator [candidate division Zixibacteria bacterium]|nr:response regulator [candidate division Zixibacteria bacterium]
MAEGWLRERQFNVVVLGIRLPGQTWHESLRAVKTLAPEAAVLMLAESADAEDMRDALSAGTYRALEPPLTADDLMAMITHDRGGVFVVLRG